MQTMDDIDRTDLDVQGVISGKAETIRMRSKRDANKKRTLIAFEDTPDIKAQRKVLQRYNAFMAEQDIQIPTPVAQTC